MEGKGAGESIDWQFGENNEACSLFCPRANRTGSEQSLIRFGAIRMEPASAVERLNDYLLSQAIPRNQGVLENRIAAFEHQYGIRVPADLKHYFITINGTAGAYAYGIIRFWDFDEFRSIANEIENTQTESAVIQSAYHEIFGSSRKFVAGISGTEENGG